MVNGGATANDAVGLWLTDNGNAKLKIASCGENLCSTIIWLNESLGEDGKPVRDSLNPDPKLKNRLVIGIPTFSGLKRAAPGKWSGMIYNPEDGKTYLVQMVVVKQGVIHVNGCRTGTMECGRRVWKRIED